MPDLRDYPLLKTAEPSAPEPNVKSAVWIAAVFIVVAAAAATVYFIRGRRPAPAPAPASVAQSAQEAVRPLGSDAEQIALPPLGESDALVRDLVRKITSHPQALAWLTTTGLIRNFTVVVANVAEGTTPAGHLRVLRLSSPFQVIERNGEIFIDPRSYDRYDGVAAAAASIDPPGASRLYATLKPRIEEAYAELGIQRTSFDLALERAIVALLQVPTVDGPVRLYPKGIGYRFADPNLERLTPAQKQLLRAGPRNVRIVQSALRQMALTLGIPPSRLP
jgi:hypothetical protein